MEPDIENILQAFDEHLQNHEKSTLTGSQKALLEWCLRHSHGKYDQIAEATPYTSKTLRDSGAKLFAVIASVVGKKVNKATCGQAVRDWYQREYALANSQLLGREADLQALLAAVAVQGRRLLCISGPPRIGKTSLVRQLCHHLQNAEDFEPPIRCYADNLPTVEGLYRNIETHLKTYLREFNPTPGLPAAAQLMHLLETRRLVLVLEKTEVLHEAGGMGGIFKAESSCYETWLRTLLERHSLQSCVIVVCREPPQCLQTNHDMLLHHPLGELQATDAERLLRQAGLQDYSVQQLSELAQFCGYNPGVLVAAAHKVRHSGEANVASFLRYPLAIAHADDAVWQGIFYDLTDKERELIGWLLLHPDETAKQADHGLEFKGQVSRSRLLVMQSLRNRGLVTTDSSGNYCLPTEWLRHLVKHNLVLRLAHAFDSGDAQVFSQHPLVVPWAPLWKRHWHWHYVLEALADHLEPLNDQAWTSQYRSTKINTMLDGIRSRPELQTGYGAGNLLNIAVALNVPLADLHMAGLTISHGDLATARLHHTNLQGCHFVNTVLPVALHGVLTAALSADGTTIAVGDEEGRILCWHCTPMAYKLYRFAQIPGTSGQPRKISHLYFGEEDMLAIVADQQVYRWWLGDGQTAPNYLMTVASPVTSLTCCGDEYVAVGQQDGSIALWHEALDCQIDLRRHLGAVQDLAANPDPYSERLVSRGHGDRILVWALNEPEPQPWEIRPERHFFFAIAWRYGHPISAVYIGDQYFLRMSDGTTDPLPFQGDISMLKFSLNGNYLAALKRQQVDIRSLDSLSQGKTIPYNGRLNTLAISNDGHWLLTVGQTRANNPYKVQLWDVETQKLCWELTAQPARNSETSLECGLNLQGCQGLTEVERAFWQSYGAIL
jgi:WD40 repeat protein